MTENWRVKAASYLESTAPPNVGKLNSLPFSDILVTLICCLRSMLTNSFLLGANCSPVTVAPERLVPRYGKSGIVVILLVIPSALNSSVLLEVRGLVNLSWTTCRAPVFIRRAPSRARTHYLRAGTGAREPEAGEVTPRLIISCNSSGFDDRANAISKVINLAK